MSNLSIFELGDRILIDTGNGGEERPGTVRFIGKTQFKDGDWLGVELDAPSGKNDGSVAGVRYFSCTPFHGLFVPPSKARLNLSGTGLSNYGNDESAPAHTQELNQNMHQFSPAVPPKTPNSTLERIESMQMDFSAVKNISDAFGTEALDPTAPKTPLAHVKSRQQTPGTSESVSELSRHQNGMNQLRMQIEAIKHELESAYETSRRSSISTGSSPTKSAVNAIIGKLNTMMLSYEQVAHQYEAMLQQLLFSRKANRLDASVARFEDEIAVLKKSKEQLSEEIDRIRNSLYTEVEKNDALEQQRHQLEQSLNQCESLLRSEHDANTALKAENERLVFANNRAQSELDVESIMEEERRRRNIDHENHIRDLKSRFESDLHQRKLKIAELENEVEYLKQTEKVLEEELNSRRGKLVGEDAEFMNREIRKAQEEAAQQKHRADEYKRLYEELQRQKERSEDGYRAEIDKLRTREHSDASKSAQNQQLHSQVATLSQDLAELSTRLSQRDMESDRLLWALEASKKENGQLMQALDELKAQAQEKDARVQALERTAKPSVTEIELESTKKTYDDEIRRVSVQLNEERARANGSAEQVQALRRRIALIEREKELLEEQLVVKRTSTATLAAADDARGFNGIVQNLRRFVETEVLSLDPLRMTMHDVLRAKELVEQLIRASEEVRMRVLGHLGQVEDVVRFRNSSSSSSTDEYADKPRFNSVPDLRSSSGMASGMKAPDSAETVKVERVKTFDLAGMEDARRRLDFTAATQATDANRYLRPSALGLLSGASTSTSTTSQPQRLTNIRSLVTENKARHSTQAPSRFSFTSSAAQPAGPEPTAPGSQQPAFESSTHYRPTTGLYPSRSLARVHEPSRCNLCHEYGHDALSCPDYLSGMDGSEDATALLDDLRPPSSNFRFVKARS